MSRHIIFWVITLEHSAQYETHQTIMMSQKLCEFVTRFTGTTGTGVFTVLLEGKACMFAQGIESFVTFLHLRVLTIDRA